MAKELEDHERAHSGKPGMKVRHGADAVGNAFQRRVAQVTGSTDDKQSQYEKSFSKHMQKTDDVQEARRRAKDELGIKYGD